jgi:perosamine synthetase
MHYGGYPCDLDDFYSLSRRHNIPIIEDCAHACGAVYKEKRIGSHGNIHAFSFHAVKNLTAGDGGALTVKSEDYFLRLKRLRWLGIDRDTFQRNRSNAYDWEYDVNEIGFKYQMNDIHAAIALSQLPFLEEQNARRAKIASLYTERLSNVPGINLLKYNTDRKSSFHLFCVLAQNRDSLVKKLRENGVAVSVHYRRNDLYPMCEKQELPNTEYFWRSVISLPMHIALTDEQIDYIADTIKKGW